MTFLTGAYTASYSPYGERGSPAYCKQSLKSSLCACAWVSSKKPAQIGHSEHHSRSPRAAGNPTMVVPHTMVCEGSLPQAALGARSHPNGIMWNMPTLCWITWHWVSWPWASVRYVSCLEWKRKNWWEFTAKSMGWGRGNLAELLQDVYQNLWHIKATKLLQDLRQIQKQIRWFLHGAAFIGEIQQLQLEAAVGDDVPGSLLFLQQVSSRPLSVCSHWWVDYKPLFHLDAPLNGCFPTRKSQIC